MKINILLYSTLLLMSISSCIVQSPMYATFDKVMELQVGMTRQMVEDKLDIPPYDLQMQDDSSTTYIYVYRVEERRTVYLNTLPKNGKVVKGRYVQLSVTYSKANRVTKMETCDACGAILTTTRKLDFNKISLFVTATLPVILIYFGLK